MMDPFWSTDDANIALFCGDALEVLGQMPDESAHCCVTSPPYYGLRDYGVDGQIGLEETPQAYIERLVAVFAEVRRVLRDDGTLWLNLGDSYWSRPNGSVGATTIDGSQAHAAAYRATNGLRKNRPACEGLKHKDLMGMPWRVALALQAAGWYLRQDIIWHKPNPMPESVTDRCTKAHEYLFLLSKSERYHYDHEAIKEPSSDPGRDSGRNGRDEYKDARRLPPNARPQTLARADFRERGRNKRSVWTVTTQPFKGAHFAVFPPRLITPCILAGCPAGGVVLDPFAGSGTTGLVAAELGRCARLIEINPTYCELAVERIMPATRQLQLEVS